MDIDARKEEVMDYRGLNNAIEWPEIPEDNLPTGYMLPRQSSGNDTYSTDHLRDVFGSFEGEDGLLLRNANSKTPPLSSVPDLAMDDAMPESEQNHNIGSPDPMNAREDDTPEARWRLYGIELEEPDNLELNLNARAIPRETTNVSAMIPRTLPENNGAQVASRESTEMSASIPHSLPENNGAPVVSTASTEMSTAIPRTLPMDNRATAIEQSRKRKQTHPSGYRGNREPYEPTPEGRARADHVDYWRTIMRTGNDKKRRVVQKQSEENGSVLQRPETQGHEDEKHEDEEHVDEEYEDEEYEDEEYEDEEYEDEEYEDEEYEDEEYEEFEDEDEQ